MDISLDTAEKVVSLVVGALTIGGLLLWRKKRTAASNGDGERQALAVSASGNSSNIDGSSSQVVNVSVSGIGSAHPSVTPASHEVLSDLDLGDLKKTARILFVDDDRGFKIVGILKKMGWSYVRIVTDLASLEDPAVLEADVIFVDIHGVGRQLHYIDEGLGLALGIKRRHAKKKVIIYSSQEEGKRFHEALQEADYSLAKTAEPVRFEETIVRVLKG
ncbi:hypothetical protein [Stenotrophomonas rhizophila]